MQQRYSIRDGIGFCRFEGRTIILDIAADRYWQLGEEAGRILEAVSSGIATGIEERALARLVALGFVAPTDPRAAGMIEAPAASGGDSPPLPSRSALEQARPSVRTGWTTACEVAALVIAARVALRRLALKTILDRFAARRGGIRSLPSETSLETLAQRFWRCRRLVPLRPLCLPDSIAFLWFAMRRAMPLGWCSASRLFPSPPIAGSRTGTSS